MSVHELSSRMNKPMPLSTSPRTFVWTGPDPDHHFSIAVNSVKRRSRVSAHGDRKIVPTAVSQLFKAISTWSHIQHIKLTNLTFPTIVLINPDTLQRQEEPLLSPIASLRTLHLGQATFLAPASVASMVCLEGMINLEQVRLVDAYGGSIWGARIRRSDVEKAGEALLAVGGMKFGGNAEEVVARIRYLVVCERQTERIMGGDRVEGTNILV